MGDSKTTDHGALTARFVSVVKKST